MPIKQDFIKTKVFGVPLNKRFDKGADGSLFVSGYFTSDARDEIGDIITRGATERAIPKYKQWGNIRYMHQPKPVAKVVKIGMQDGLEWNEAQIKVIDPQAVFEVENGLLTALSVGILVNMDDIEMQEDGGWVINDYSLAEISLVDHPANYDARLKSMDVEQGLRYLARSYGLKNLALGIENMLNTELAMTDEIIKEEDTPEMGSEIVEEAEKSVQVEKSPACRQADESKDECVSRKIPEIMKEDPEMDQKQAIAIAESMCSKSCDEKEDAMEAEEDCGCPDKVKSLEQDEPEGTEPAIPASIEEEEPKLEAELQVEAHEHSADCGCPEALLDVQEEEEIISEPTIEEALNDALLEDAITPDEIRGMFEELSKSISELKNSFASFSKSAETQTEAPEAEQVEGDAEIEKVIASQVVDETPAVPANRDGAIQETTLPEQTKEEKEKTEPTTLREALSKYISSKNSR